MYPKLRTIATETGTVTWVNPPHYLSVWIGVWRCSCKHNDGYWMIHHILVHTVLYAIDILRQVQVLHLSTRSCNDSSVPCCSSNKPRNVERRQFKLAIIFLFLLCSSSLHVRRNTVQKADARSALHWGTVTCCSRTYTGRYERQHTVLLFRNTLSL
jgi:hypothetical protein